MTRTFLLALGMTLAGCASPLVEDGAEGVAASNLTIATTFYCGRDGGDIDLSLNLSHRGERLHVEWGLENIVTGDGTIDPTYRPRPGNANFVRFTGDGLHGLDEGFANRTTVLIEKPLLQGKPGRAKIQMLRPNGELEQSDNACQPAR